MRRRTFLATAPIAAAGVAVAARAQNDERGPRPAAYWRPEDRDYSPENVQGGDRPIGASFASRTAVYGRSGAAGTAHPLATLAGIDILRAGGSAVDAAIAINACLGFLEPTSCGIGGDVYAMLWDPAQRKVVGLAGSGRSPRGLSLETVRSRARPDGTLPPYGAVSVSVPGAVDGWWTLHRRYGKLPWKDLFRPAIALAEEAAPVPDVIAAYTRSAMANFTRRASEMEESANARAVWGAGPAKGGVFRNPDLAHTYRLIAEGGRDAFYDGPIADAIERYFRRIGGWMTRADLAAQRAEWSQPFATDYRGVTVHALGANTQGVATLQMLNMIERFDMRAEGFQSARAIHLAAEAKRLAYEDRARYYADPGFSKVPFDWLVSKDYAAQRARLISPTRINPGVQPGSAPSNGDTTYFTAADKWGMSVSMIQSNFRGMGSGLVADGIQGGTLGFMFQDRGQLFSLKGDHPNLYAPGKRPFQTIIPGFATKGGAPWLSFGVMGGDMQPQGQAQIIMNTVDFGLDIQSAGDSPRWHHEGSSQSMGEDAPNLGPTGLLRLESGVPKATRQALADMGWTIGESDGGFGRYQCIEHRQDGEARVYAAASEMRADGCALAY